MFGAMFCEGLNGRPMAKASRSGHSAQQRYISFAHINIAALAHSSALAERWLPGGRREGSEWVSLNPLRHDSRLGSFKVNLRTGKWCDFATDARGGDLTSLAAYLFNLSQFDAAMRVAEMLRVDPHG
jgi:hypothetical protein